MVGDEHVRLMAACDASLCVWLAPIVRLAIETAMRQGEIMSLTWKQLDPHRPVAHLIDTKNGEARDVPLSPEACVVLNSLPRSIGGKVFPISAQVLDDHWRTAVKLAGIEDLRFHDLRHEATSRIFEKGLNPMEAAAVTGHKTLSMLKRYTHLKAEDLAKRL